MPPKQKWYAVCVGRQPGIYATWDETKAQVDRFPKSRFKSFPTKSAAEDWLLSGGLASEVVDLTVGEESSLATSILGKRGWESYAKQMDIIDLTTDNDGDTAPPGPGRREEMEQEATSPYFRNPSAVEQPTILRGGRSRPSPGGDRAAGESWPDGSDEDDDNYDASQQTPTSSPLSSRDSTHLRHTT
ncbi:hypothetical protein K440DRAFT_422169 [Wilcoxina mikolae CBS 423.85]|nr:hypothetical protein K440DRAFT_422169 [Wilcoxina mikolae CBS 423.85]